MQRNAEEYEELIETEMTAAEKQFTGSEAMRHVARAQVWATVLLALRTTETSS